MATGDWAQVKARSGAPKTPNFAPNLRARVPACSASMDFAREGIVPPYIVLEICFAQDVDTAEQIKYTSVKGQ